ncbi:MAG TPA: PVC-type heme-binding CxxCH protein [Planctomycetaceae bacterium]|nr:PVC-type heme-binding CxxCH protein [Planctomycetaceae bacterium]
MTDRLQQLSGTRPRRIAFGGLAAWLILTASPAGIAVGAADERPAAAAPASPTSPEDALRHFELHPELRIELVAAEPDVVDPVAIRFDEDGRMWVVEMRDYPDGPAAGQPPLSRIRVLEDADGDGRYESSRVFADGLLFATGVQPWRGGVIVTFAGEVAYLKDTDGDGTADLRETWFTGFAQENPQLRANHPTFALDNHVYVANGLRGGDVIARRDGWSEGAKPVSISGMDFRFDPLTGRYEAVSGLGQFGLTFDDFGRRFVCSNRNPCRHVVLEDRYLKRNPHLAVASVVEDVSPAAEDSRVYAISRTWTTSTLHAGQFTAACGVTIYRGDLLPDEFRGNSFVCEPTGNLVHRDVLEPHGATFKSRPGREGVEFLASRDEWFRPVNLANGPDGALYVVDMYRAVIEHPQFMPDELKRRPDMRHGDDRGRIYRIVPKRSRGLPACGSDENAADKTPVDDEPQAGRPRLRPLSTASTAALVDLLTHPNAWHRETAQRLLVERQDPSAVEPLRELTKDESSAHAAVHALWTLKGLSRIEPGLLASLVLTSRSPEVCEQALVLIEPWLKAAESGASPETGLPPQRILHVLSRGARARDERYARFRFQTALALGELRAPPFDEHWMTENLGEISLHGSDEWIRTAVLTSAGERPADLTRYMLNAAVRAGDWDAVARESVRRTCELVGSRQADVDVALVELAAVPASTAELRVRLAGLRGLGQGLSRRGKPLWPEVLKAPGAVDREIGVLFEEAAGLARSTANDAELRQEAIDVLRFGRYPPVAPVLKLLARDPSEPAIQLAAIDALARFREDEIGPFLLDGFDSQTPAVRRAVLDAMLANAGRTTFLLSEIEAGRFDPRELDQARVTRLTSHGNAEIRARAKPLLESTVAPDRQQVLKEYHAALFGAGGLYASADPERGRGVFEKNCVTCHRIGALGVNVAPDIADSRVRQPEQLLADILDPNRAVDSNYFSYTVVTAEGATHTGIIAAETATSVTLRQPEDKTVTILRSEIEEIKSNKVSLMPDGLEKTIPPGQMAELVSFIKNWRYLDGQVPLK